MWIFVCCYGIWKPYLQHVFAHRNAYPKMQCVHNCWRHKILRFIKYTHTLEQVNTSASGYACTFLAMHSYEQENAASVTPGHHNKRNILHSMPMLCSLQSCARSLILLHVGQRFHNFLVFFVLALGLWFTIKWPWVLTQELALSIPKSTTQLPYHYLDPLQNLKLIDA